MTDTEILVLAKRLAADFDLDIDKLAPSGGGFSQAEFIKAAERQIARRESERPAEEKP